MAKSNSFPEFRHATSLLLRSKTGINEKLRLKIASRKASLYVLGDGGEACQELKSRCEQAVLELGTDAKVHRGNRSRPLLHLMALRRCRLRPS